MALREHVGSVDEQEKQVQLDRRDLRALEVYQVEMEQLVVQVLLGAMEM